MDDVQTPPDMSFTSSPRIVPSMLGDWTGKKVRLMGIVSGSIFLAYFACHPFRVLPAGAERTCAQVRDVSGGTAVVESSDGRVTIVDTTIEEACAGRCVEVTLRPRSPTTRAR
jgi:hypothetical protein